MGRKLVVKQFIVPVCMIFFLVGIGSVAAQYNPGHPADQIDFSVPIENQTGHSVVKIAAPEYYVAAVDFFINETDEWGIGRLNEGNKFYIAEYGVAPWLVITPGGNVGISTQDPQTTLHVEGDIFASNTICDSSGKCVGDIVSYWQEGIGGIYYNDGNVGIGTASPEAKLHVVGTLKTDGGATIIGLAPENTGLTLSDEGSYKRIQTWGGEPLAINPEGNNVGIGKTSPSYKLDVAGSIQADGGWVRVTGDRGIFFQDHGGGWYMTDDTWIRAYNSKPVWISEHLGVAGGVHVGSSDDPGTENLVVDGEMRQGGTDYGGYEIQTGGQIYTNDYLIALGGIHVGGTSDPGTDKLIVDGEIQQGGTDYGGYEIQTGGEIYSGSYTRADGGFQVDGRTMISGTGVIHTARNTDNTHYGYFEVRRNDSVRGAYFGWGNGGNAVTLHLDNAGKLDVTGGNVDVEYTLYAEQVQSDDIVRGKRFIDLDDANFYVNPASTSKLYDLYISNILRGTDGNLRISLPSYGNAVKVNNKDMIIRVTGGNILMAPDYAAIGYGEHSCPNGWECKMDTWDALFQSIKIHGSCVGCSVIAEMTPIEGTFNDGDVICVNPGTGENEQCAHDKAMNFIGIATIYAEQILRSSCSAHSEEEQSTILGSTKEVLNNPNCEGWYPIALVGLLEQANVICERPDGTELQYGDRLVASNTPGHLRALLPDEQGGDAVVAKAQTKCTSGKATDKIQVWIH